MKDRKPLERYPKDPKRVFPDGFKIDPEVFKKVRENRENEEIEKYKDKPPGYTVSE